MKVLTLQLHAGSSHSWSDTAKPQIPKTVFHEPASQFLRRLVWTSLEVLHYILARVKASKVKPHALGYFNIPEDVLLI